MPFDFACLDWVDKLERCETPIADLPLDVSASDRAIAAYNKLHLPDVIGTPPLSEAGGDWFRDIIAAIFGSIDKKTGVRQVGEVFLQVPKKNSKTTNGAALALVVLLMNTRPNADLLLVGPTQQISKLAFAQLEGMIEADPPDVTGKRYLKARFDVKAYESAIIDRVTGARLQVRTFDNKILTGIKPIFVVVDEVHVLGQMAKADEVYTQIRGGFLPFPESLFVQITTQSDKPPAGIYKKELQYARAVRDGRITENVNTLPVIYEFPEEMQRDKAKLWEDPAVWPMVTPNLGRSITIDGLIMGYERAKAGGAEDVARWSSQHLNIEIGLALHSERWIGADYWQGSASESVTLDRILTDCDVVVAGFDGGGLDDMAGLCVTGRERESRNWLNYFHGWIHPDALKVREGNRAQMLDFAAAGDLTICENDNPTQDFEEVAALLALVRASNLMPSEGAVGLDTYGVAGLVDALLECGFTEDELCGVPQGYKLSSAIWGIERKLKDGTFQHSGSDFMAWVVGNAKAELRGNNIYISKAAAGKAKIDPLTAAFNSYQLMSRNPTPAGAGSVLLGMAEAVV